MTDSVGLNLSKDGVREAFAALVREAATGDRHAMERLLMRAQEVAYRFSLLVCGHPEDAEDVMQEALLKTYENVARIAEPEAFRTWLYTTVRNSCLMKRRRRVGEPAHLLSLDEGAPSDGGDHVPIDVEDTGRPADQLVMDAWIDRRLREALLELPRSYRAMIVMRDIEGLTTREVARVVGISEANVKTRLHRARMMLRRQLEGSGRMEGL